MHFYELLTLGDKDKRLNSVFRRENTLMHNDIVWSIKKSRNEAQKMVASVDYLKKENTRESRKISFCVSNLPRFGIVKRQDA